MADAVPQPSDCSAASRKNQPRGPSRFQQLNKLYALPAPLRTFPLPTFIPHNPLSLFHILYVWVSQAVKPQTSHFDDLYIGSFSSDTRSVHVTDVRSIRGLWEQGFYGKGTLSRSEPSWANRERTRRGEKTKTSSEENTRKRRADRQQTKWERARKEREAIDEKLREEAALAIEASIDVDEDAVDVPCVAELKVMPKRMAAVPTISQAANPATIETERPVTKPAANESSHDEAVLDLKSVIVGFRPPVGPQELLALPNSQLDWVSTTGAGLPADIDINQRIMSHHRSAPVGPLELLALPNSLAFPHNAPLQMEDIIVVECNGKTPTATRSWHDPLPSVLESKGFAPNDGKILSVATRMPPEDTDVIGGSETNEDTVDESMHSEETTESHDTPPNGSIVASSRPTTPKMKRQKSVRFSPTVEKNTFLQSEPPSPERAAAASAVVEEQPIEIQNQEHLQLTLEEAFFLSYALGALTIFDPETQAITPNQDLFYMLRKASYFPPRADPTPSPDDPFMINYVAYHHFRSLGWVVRSGVKFSVDYMLYNRGPVFSHAEFAVLVLPSYSDPYWISTPFLENYSKEKQKRSWAWMSCINRVITQVKKTLILTYVDIPKPLSVQEEHDLGIHGVLSRYQVREFVMNRFAANRMRD